MPSEHVERGPLLRRSAATLIETPEIRGPAQACVQIDHRLRHSGLMANRTGAQGRPFSDVPCNIAVFPSTTLADFGD